MDSEKYVELQNEIREGRSPNDEGPYYHHAWWEAYKGDVKGKQGGVVVGALVGAIMGAIVASGIALFSPLILGASLLLGMAAVTGAFAAAGAIYGGHEFGNIGQTVGALAATQEQAEARMKTFEDGRFAEIKEDIAEIKALVKGETPPPRRDVSPKDPGYRTTHYAKLSGAAPGINKYVFWKVALIGLAVGVATGGLLAYGGLAAGVLDGLVGAGGALSPVGVATASMTVMGALGASFGINRDIFRQIFDKTDLWFKGMLRHDKIGADQIAAGREILNSRGNEKTESPQVATAVMPGFIDYPGSSTYHRDKVLAAAEKALISFDHTRATLN